MLEDKNTEFKREYVEDIKKMLVAFANTDVVIFISEVTMTAMLLKSIILTVLCYR